MRLLYRLLIALTLAVSTAAADDTRLEIIEVKHRPAAEIGYAIHSLLGSEEGISWYGNHLIVRARPATLEQVRVLLVDLDRPAKSLRVEVRWGDTGDGSATEWQVLDSAGVGTTSRVEPRIERRITTRRETRIQSVRVIEGQAALIRQGTAVPYPEVVVVRSGEIAAAGLAWRDVDSGFAVRPSVLGERIRLAIEPVHARESPEGGGRILTAGASTVMEVESGEWMEIGGASTDRDERGTRILGATRDRSRDNSRVFVRVTVE